MGTVAERQVAHIWKRLGFGATSADIDPWAAAGPSALVTDLLNRPLTTSENWNFTTATDWQGQGRFLGQHLRLMGSAANPLQERMAWVLQGLVVVGLDGTSQFPDVRGHVLRLRSNPFASYKRLLTDVTILPGMMKYLSGFQNSRLHPNQNYARELMELFSLGLTHPKTGVQNYTEADVREVARALNRLGGSGTDSSVLGSGFADLGIFSRPQVPAGGAGTGSATTTTTTVPSSSTTSTTTAPAPQPPRCRCDEPRPPEAGCYARLWARDRDADSVASAGA